MRIRTTLLLVPLFPLLTGAAYAADAQAPAAAAVSTAPAQAQPAAAPAAQSTPTPAATETEKTGAPTQAVQDLVNTAKKYDDENEKGISPEEKQRRLAMKDRINGILDLKEMAHQILIKKWDALKPGEREKYASLLSGLVQKVGYPQIGKYFNGQIEVKCVGEKPLDGGNQEVLTHIVYKEEDLTLNTEFRLHPTATGWRIYDVVTDGESLLLIYRNQHMGIIKDKGFPELVRLMEKKLNAN
jgi:phospholipid transport system substrate-binding protein